jgi:hypothetical protein
MGKDYTADNQRPTWKFGGIAKKAFPGELSHLTPWADEPKIEEPVQKGVFDGLTRFFATNQFFHMGRVGGGGGESAGRRGLAQRLGMDSGGTPGVASGRGKVGKGGDPRGMEAAIRESAVKYGVDPDTAVAVAKSEGLANYTGDGGTSFGAFQLHTGGGLGDTFKNETGLDPRDPKNERAMIDWTLKNANKTGWGPYHGAAKTGIGSRAGLGGSGSSGAGRSGGVDPRIKEIVSAAATHLPKGYSIGMTSGYRGPNVPNHNGNAADYQIIGPDGKPLSNRGDDPTGLYAKLAQNSYGEMLARSPELKGRFAWGGAFGTQLDGGGPRDLMHFDINGERGRYNQYQLGNMGVVPGERYGRHGANLRDHIRNGRKPATDGTLLDNGKRSDGGGLNGSASLTIDLNGFPRGTRTSSAHEGLFKEVRLNRGRPMAYASDIS